MPHKRFGRFAKKITSGGDSPITMDRLQKKTVSFRKLPQIRIANVKSTYFTNLSIPTREKSTKMLLNASTLFNKKQIFTRRSTNDKLY